MSGSAQSSDSMLSGADARQAAARRSSPPRRDSLMHPTGLPLGFALGCCLGLITALIVFF